MADRIRWIEHKGKSILFLDYSDLHGDEYIKTIKETEDFIINLGNYDLLVLNDITNSYADKFSYEAGKETAEKIKPYVRKDAIVGLTTVKETLLKVIGMFSDLVIKPFDTIEEAKDWLVE